jgi:hypothetical protein
MFAESTINFRSEPVNDLHLDWNIMCAFFEFISEAICNSLKENRAEQHHAFSGDLEGDSKLSILAAETLISRCKQRVRAAVT